MKENERVSVDIDQLAFNRMDEDSESIYIPLKDRRGYVFCVNRANHPGALLCIKEGKHWNDSILDEESTVKIYKKLKEL